MLLNHQTCVAADIHGANSFTGLDESRMRVLGAAYKRAREIENAGLTEQIELPFSAASERKRLYKLVERSVPPQLFLSDAHERQAIIENNWRAVIAFVETSIIEDKRRQERDVADLGREEQLTLAQAWRARYWTIAMARSWYCYRDRAFLTTIQTMHDWKLVFRYSKGPISGGVQGPLPVVGTSRRDFNRRLLEALQSGSVPHLHRGIAHENHWQLLSEPSCEAFEGFIFGRDEIIGIFQPQNALAVTPEPLGAIPRPSTATVIVGIHNPAAVLRRQVKDSDLNHPHLERDHDGVSLADIEDALELAGCSIEIPNVKFRFALDNIKTPLRPQNLIDQKMRFLGQLLVLKTIFELPFPKSGRMLGWANVRSAFHEKVATYTRYLVIDNDSASIRYDRAKIEHENQLIAENEKAKREGRLDRLSELLPTPAKRVAPRVFKSKKSDWVEKEGRGFAKHHLYGEAVRERLRALKIGNGDRVKTGSTDMSAEAREVRLSLKSGVAP